MPTRETKSALLQFIGATPEMRVVDFLMENYLFDYFKKDIAEGAGISRVTLYKVFPKLVEKGIVTETRRIGCGRFYKINSENQLVQQLYAMELKLIHDLSKEISQNST